MGNGWRGRAAKADPRTPGPRREAQEDRPRKIDLQREVHEYKPTKIDLRREAYEDRPTKTTGSPMILSSSMAEHSAVNRVVVGSSPTWGANTPHSVVRSFFVIIRQKRRAETLNPQETQETASPTQETASPNITEKLVSAQNAAQTRKFASEFERSGNLKLQDLESHPAKSIAFEGNK